MAVGGLQLRARGRTIINLDDEEVREALAGNLCRCTAAASGGKRMSGTLVIENRAVATVDGRGSEYAVGYVVVSDGRIVQVGPGAAPVLQHDGARVVDGSGCLATPGLANSPLNPPGLDAAP
jgi:hypothetical protein